MAAPAAGAGAGAGASGVAVDVAPFLERAYLLYKHMAGNRAAWSDAGSLLLPTAKAMSFGEQEDSYSVTLQKLLLGYEFPDTIMLLAGKTLLVHATGKKLDYFRPLIEAAKGWATGPGAPGFGGSVGAVRGEAYPLTLELVPREKGDGVVDAVVARVVDLIKGHGGIVALPPDSVDSSPITAAFVAAVRAAAGVTVVDAAKPLELYWSVKDEAAIGQATKAGHMLARVARKVFVGEMETIFDEEHAISNVQLAAKVDASMSELAKHGIKVDSDNIDWTVHPVVLSGGENTANLHTGAVKSNDKPLSPDVVHFAAAARYGMFSAYVARTYMIDPTPQQLTMYNAVLDAHLLLMDRLRAGAVIGDVVKAVQEKLMSVPSLPEQATLLRTLGCGCGQRLSDKALMLTTKNTTVVTPGMMFAVWVGLNNLPVIGKPAAGAAMGKLATYSIYMADTIVATDAVPLFLTDKLPRERTAVIYNMAGGDDEDEDEDEGAGAGAGAKKRGGDEDVSGVIGRRTRSSARAKDTAEEEESRRRREAHQVLLFEKKEAEGRRAYKSGDAAGGAGAGASRDDLAHAAAIAAYKSSAEYPRSTPATQLSVDKAHDVVLVPLLGTVVPFHVSTIKTVAKTDEGHKGFLRLNFYTPSGAPGKECPPSMQAAMLRHGDAAWIKTLNFVSRSHGNLSNMAQVIRAMQKKAKTDREDEKLRSELVEQQKLVLSRDQVPRLEDISMWPAISGRKTTGTLETHTNGLRFVSSKGEKVEIIYANVKHGIFQPCHNEHIVLIHFHLRHPIMIGKKKYRDVQFFTDVVESSAAIDSRRGEELDELAEEERDRRVRQEMNKFFKRFTERTEQVAERDSGGWHSFEVPQRDLLFSGTPGREMVNMVPCTDCLVALVEKPPFVASVDAVDHVHFERVTYANKDFDMVLIYKPGMKEKGEEQFSRISAIPMKDLDLVKKWLDEVAEITYTEGVGSYNWKSIIEDVVRADNFYASSDEEGEAKPVGWNFLRDEAWAAEEGGDDDEGESEFSGEEEDEEEEDDDSEFDDNVDDEEEDDDDDFEGGEDDDDDEDDWEELDRKAEEDDRKRKRKDMEGGDKDRKKREKESAKKPRKG